MGLSPKDYFYVHLETTYFPTGAQKARLHRAAGSPEQFHEMLVDVFRLRVPDLFLMDAVVGETLIRLVKQMLQNLKKQYQYLGVLKKIISDALGAVQSPSLPHRQEAFKLVEQYLA
jgi:hypothetical protein